MGALVENELDRVKDVFLEFTHYLRTDFAGASKLAWDIFLEGIKLASKTAMDLALRAGKGIVAALKEGLIGSQFQEQISEEAYRRYNELGYGKMDVSEPWSGRGLIPLHGPVIEVGRPEDPALLQRLTEDVRKEYENKWIEQTVEEGSGRIKGWADESKKRINGWIGATPMSGSYDQINAEHDATRAGLMQQRGLRQWDRLVEWGKDQWSGMRSIYQGFVGGPAGPGAPAGAATPTFAGGRQAAAPGVDSRAVQATEDLLNKLRVEQEMLSQTTEERAKTVALEELRSEINAATNEKLETQADLEAKYGEQVKKITDAIEKLEKARRLTQTAQDIGRAFGSAFDDFVLGAKNASEAVTALGLDIARALLHNMVTQPLVDAISKGLSGVFNPTVKVHGGWQVGMAGASTLNVPASLFWGAPRLHGGLASDEFPAILQRGETVLPAGTSARPSVTVNITNNSSAPVAASVKDLKFDLRRMIVGVVLEDQQTNGPITRGYRR